MKPLRIEIKHFAMVSLFAAIAVAPMLFRGIPGGNDAIQHYEFAQHIIDSINAGEIAPSFAANANRGLGDVGLRVYPPLAYYSLAILYLVLGEWFAASIAMFFLILLIGGLGVYLWARESFSPEVGIAAAAAYTFAPFHLNEIYNNFLYAEFAAGAVLPFCFLFVSRVIRSGGFLDTALLGAACALLIATHLPLTIVGAISISVYVLASLRRGEFRRLWNLSASAICGLLLSSFYWVRMIAEMNWVKHSQPEYFSEIWSYRENFLISGRTFLNFMGDDLSLWFGDLMLLSTLVICIPGLVAFRKLNVASLNIRPLLILLIFSVFMTNPLSAFIWDNLDPLQKVQFPWRWLAVVSLAAAPIAGAGLVKAGERLSSGNGKFKAVMIAVTVLPYVFLSAFVVRAPHFTPRTEFNQRTASLSAGQTFQGWWPLWAKGVAFSRKEKVQTNGRSVEIEKWDLTFRSFIVDQGPAQPIVVATFYYPHWRAKIEGVETEILPSTDGVIVLNVPTGTSKVELSFVEPKIVTASEFVSAAGWAILAILIIIVFVRTRNRYGTYR